MQRSEKLELKMLTLDRLTVHSTQEGRSHVQISRYASALDEDLQLLVLADLTSVTTAELKEGEDGSEQL